MLHKIKHPGVIAVAIIAALLLTLGILSPAGAAIRHQFGSSDIKNNSLRSADLKDGTVKSRDIQDGTITDADIAPGTVTDGQDGTNGTDGKDGKDGKDGTGTAGPQGPQGPKGEPGPAFSYVGANWSLIDRNSIGNFVGALRAGPSSEAFGASEAPPLGVGSLGLQTGSANDKIAWGNQVDYAGDLLSSLTTVKFDVFTTGENIANGGGAVNLPGVTFEIDPSGPTNTARLNYSSLVYVPVAAQAGWSTQDASTARQWFLTGDAGIGSCNQGSDGYCTLSEVKAKFPNATVFTVAFGKGRDYAFTGAVDKLVLNSTTYDFEPNGVRQAG